MSELVSEDKVFKSLWEQMNRLFPTRFLNAYKNNIISVI